LSWVVYIYETTQVVTANLVFSNETRRTSRKLFIIHIMCI